MTLRVSWTISARSYPCSHSGRGFGTCSAVDGLNAGQSASCATVLAILNMCAAGAVVQLTLLETENCTRLKLLKDRRTGCSGDGVGVHEFRRLAQPSSPWDDPDFKLAV